MRTGLQFAINRLIQGLITLFLLATIVFLLARIIGNPVDSLLPPDATLADREFMIKRLGLDQPLLVQYVQFILALLRGDLGTSIRFGVPVSDLFFARFPNTVRLAVVSFAFATTVGTLLGVVSALNKDGVIDRLARTIAVVGMSAPSFWVGLMLILFISVQLRLLPVAQMGGPASYVLPAFTLGLFLLAGTSRLVRSSMIEILDTEYIKLARLKGLSQGAVIWKHALRNALIPVMTFAGMNLASMLNGSVAIESVFAWPGVGRLVFEGITGRDYPLVQGCLLLIGFIVVIISALVDILYSLIDPRIRLSASA